MDLKVLKDKWMELVNKANSAGVPVPMIRDPKSGAGSVSLTLVFISFNVWLASVIGKLSGRLGGIDQSQCLNMFLACSGLYFGRKFQKDGAKAELSEKDASSDESK